MSSKPTYEKLEQRIRELEQDLEQAKALNPLYEKDFREQIFAVSPVGLAVYNADSGQCVTASKAIAEFVGASEEQVLAQKIYEIRSWKKSGLLATAKSALNDNSRKHIDVTMTTTFGKNISAACHFVPFLAGNQKYLLLTVTDITEHKRMAEALRESLDFREQILSASPVGISIYNADSGQCVAASKSMSKLIGGTEAQVLSQNFTGIPSWKRSGLLDKAMSALRDNSQKSLEVTVTTSFGKNMTADCHFAPFISGNQKYLLFTLTDITDRKKTEASLRESEAKLARSGKMESLGLLAGGVAHDLNNILSGIVSYPELILMDLPEDSRLREPIQTMHNAGQRAAAVVNDLLTVARGVATPRKTINLNTIILDYLDSHELRVLRQLHPEVTVDCALDKGLLNISGSQIHIRKTILNLVSNAMESVNNCGHITISTANRYNDKPLKRYDDINIGEYAVLSVSDNGPGISPDDLERIFEPFYSKKVMGRSGTGLGLAVVWNVMQDHRGYIDIKSSEKDTTFELYFPITREDIFDYDISVPFESYRGNNEKILVIDDEESQRKISCKMLEALGYQAIPVSSGERAVEYLKDHTVDLLLLDMIMDPGMNGRETYERIIQDHPGQRAIIVSGFAETDEVLKAQKSGAGKYVKKPLTIESLGLAVKMELEK